MRRSQRATTTQAAPRGWPRQVAGQSRAPTIELRRAGSGSDELAESARHAMMLPNLPQQRTRPKRRAAERLIR